MPQNRFKNNLWDFIFYFPLFSYLLPSFIIIYLHFKSREYAEKRK